MLCCMQQSLFLLIKDKIVLTGKNNTNIKVRTAKNNTSIKKVIIG